MRMGAILGHVARPRRCGCVGRVAGVQQQLLLPLPPVALVVSGGLKVLHLGVKVYLPCHPEMELCSKRDAPVLVMG